MCANKLKNYLLAGGMLMALGLGVLAVTWSEKRSATQQASLPVLADIGGDFELTGSGGTHIALKNYRGQVVILFFGYTYCPDVCPTSMYTLKRAMDLLGPVSEQVQVLMVTVDPERDSADHLQKYVSHFHPRFIGLSGKPKEIDRVAKAYLVHYEKDASIGATYLVGHSAFFYLLDQQGRVRVLHDPRSTPENIAADVQRLLAR